MNILINIILIIIAVLLFCLIITIHEFGHFSMAKLSKVRVNEFAIGMGPVIAKFTKGETQYSIRLLPIGGYCAMEGEDEESSDKNSFGSKSVWKRILIISMGAIFNIILGVILMMIILGGQSGFASTTVAEFMDGATTSESGLQVDDKIIDVNGYKVSTYNDFSFALGTDTQVRNSLKEGTNPTVDILVMRNGEKVLLNNVQFNTTTNSKGDNELQLDFKVLGIQKTFNTLITQAISNTVSTVRMVWASLMGLIVGKFGFNDMAGPIGMASAMSESASAGLQISFGAALNNILYIMALITVNLGIFNLLPLPALDGGRLVFLFVELITRKRIPAKYEGWVHAAGFVLLIGLMVLVTFSDVLRLLTGSGLGG